MYKSITSSAQLLALADRLGFGKIYNEKKADKRYRHFTARTQLYAMMVAQLTEQKGLRTIEETIASDNDLCSEISVALFKHRNLEKWFARDYEKFPPKLMPEKTLCGCLMIWRVNWTGM